MSQVITKRVRLSRRIFLRGLTATQLPVIVGIPPLVSMFNSTGTAYAAETPVRAGGARPVEKRFVIWFNGNGIPERYWIPATTGVNYDITPCLTPIGRLKDDILVLSGLDNTYGGNGHPQSLCALMTCPRLSSTGPSAPSLDQVLAARIGGNSRFRSLQIGVSQESFGGALQKNMTWAGSNRPLPPEEIPHRLFDRLFGARDLGWVNRKRSILDAVAQDGALLRKGLPKEDEARLDEHLSSIRDLERAIASLPPDYRKVARPDEDFDMKDWPRVAKLQSDMLAYAFATNQTRVASYMLTKCQAWPAFRGWATPPRGTTITPIKTARHRAKMVKKGSGFSATSVAGMSRSSPTWWRNSSLFPKATAPCWTIPRSCMYTSTQKQDRTRPAA